MEEDYTMNNWDNLNSNPIEDIRKLAEEIKKNIGMDRPPDFGQALYNEVQSMYMIGFSPEQVIAYIEGLYKLAKKYHDEQTSK